MIFRTAYHILLTKSKNINLIKDIYSKDYI